MSAILDQLGLDSTFFVQFFIFAILFVFLGKFYFAPFLQLFEIRHKKTVEDRETAEKLMLQAQAKLDEYKRKLSEERASALREYEGAINEAKKEEATIFAHAREQAKKLTQEAADSVATQKDQLKRQLEADVENLARAISERLLSRKV